jgi:L-lactate dehydrogenase (cytochrome)
MRLKNAMCIEDLRRIAKRNVPGVFFEYMEAGSYSEHTRDANVDDMRAIKLRQRVLVDVSQRKLSTTVLGEELAMPLALAPTGLAGMQYADGEILACRAAHAAGIQYTLSTMSICSIEDVQSVVSKPFWFQLYMFRDRGFSQSVIERARAAKCSALFVTVDLPMRGQRHADIKNGLTVPPRLTVRNAFDIATKPAWLIKVLLGRRKTFGNVEAYLKGRVGIEKAGAWSNQNFDRSLNWRDVEWVRSLWPGKLVLKGMLDVEDAKTAASAGVDGIVVSNHGGRQLDGAHSTIRVLPDIASAVGDRIEVLFDGGIRSGHDVLKALARGAHGCLIGRAYLYGLAANGEAGVRQALDIIRAELEVALTLTGTRDVRAVTREVIG